jgi:DNA-binding IclR family transcriptional regulator
VRGLEVLDVVAAGGGTATAKQIARQLGLTQSTCYHLLRTLKSEGYIVRVGSAAYDVGPRGGRLGRNLDNRFGPSPEVSALLSRLHSKTHETAYVCGWYHGTIVMQQFIGGTGPVMVGQLVVGYSGDMHARASCKSVLAHLPAEIVQTMFDGVPLRALTPHTTVGYPELVQELRQIKRQGYALDIDEFAEGVCCASAAFFDAEGSPVGSFTVSVPSGKFDSLRAAIVTEVIEAASLATTMLRTGRLSVPEQSTPSPLSTGRNAAPRSLDRRTELS